MTAPTAIREKPHENFQTGKRILLFGRWFSDEKDADDKFNCCGFRTAITSRVRYSSNRARLAEKKEQNGKRKLRDKCRLVRRMLFRRTRRKRRQTKP